MAKRDQKEKLNYNAELRRLKEEGPQRLYFLWGPEDYLRELFLTELRRACVPTEDDFSCQRFNGPALDLSALAEAVDALPFFSERRFVEVRDWDLGGCKETELKRLKEIIGDVPDYCTLCFVFGASAPPDGRLAAAKALKKAARCMEFTEQEEGALRRWVISRFQALGKSVAPADAEYLIFLSGARMNALIPEIEKAAAYAARETVTRADIDATATRIPEANVFEMINHLSLRRYDAAARLLQELLEDRDNKAIMINALIAQQFRRMYAYRVGQAAQRSRAELMELCGVSYDSVFNKLAAAARAFSEARLAELIRRCAACDYQMKSTGLDQEALLLELFAGIAAEV